MCCISRRACLTILLLAGSGMSQAENFVLGGALAGDSEDGQAISVFGDFGLMDNTWLSGTAGATETRSSLGDFSTTFADVGIDHFFEPLGVRVSGAYWGDADILESADLRASVYYRNDTASVAADYERRNFNFIFGTDRPRGRRTVEFHADGLGATARFKTSRNTTVRLTGMVYDYSRNIRIQRDIDRVRFLSASRLSLMNSLIDHRYNAAFEYRFGLKSVDFSVGGWKTAVDQTAVNSYTAGFVTPMTDRTDIEIRLSFDDSDSYGSVTALTFYLYYFGGS